MTSTRTRKPSVATMRAYLVKHTATTKDEAAALAPKALLTAYEAALLTDTSTSDAQPPAKTPAKGKPASTPRPPSNCGCGCGAPTVTAKARFLSGHDARFAGMVGRGEVEITDPTVVTPALQAKIDRIRETTAHKAAAKQAKVAAKAAADKAYADALKAAGL